MFVFEFEEALFAFEYTRPPFAFALLFERPNTRPLGVFHLFIFSHSGGITRPSLPLLADLAFVLDFTEEADATAEGRARER